MTQPQKRHIPKRVQRTMRREGRELLFFPLFVLVLGIMLVSVLQHIYSYTVRDHIFFYLLPLLGLVGTMRFGYVGLMGYHSPHRTKCGSYILAQAEQEGPDALEQLCREVNGDLAAGQKVGSLLMGETWLKCGRLYVKKSHLRAYYLKEEWDWRTRTVLCLQKENGESIRVPGGTKRTLAVLNALQAGLLPGLVQINSPAVPGEEEFFPETVEIPAGEGIFR